MSYLLDKKLKRQKIFYFFIGVFIVGVLFFFRSAIFYGFSNASHFIFRPVIALGNSFGSTVYSSRSFFLSKKSLLKENESLKTQILESEADRANYASVVDENIKLKEILGRKNENIKLVLTGILSQANQSLYGTLIIDAGEKEGIRVGARVFAMGNIPVGYVAEVFPNTSKVLLYSSPSEKTEVVISGHGVFMQAIGRGEGNFELVMPRGLVIEKGAEIDLPGVHPYIFATVADIISDPRDSFQKALLVSPINIGELKFVQVEN
ncbi:MAG: rod shape-determining protein MreC [Patescibacteria group bacterium]